MVNLHDLFGLKDEIYKESTRLREMIRVLKLKSPLPRSPQTFMKEKKANISDFFL